METRSSRWQCTPYEVGSALRLERSLGISPTLAAVLVRRGLADPDAANRFLDAGERHDPLTLPGLAPAADLILAHIGRGSRIAVHGDYDVDGVCSTAILVRALRALGADPTWEIPSRFDDGYGLSGATVERLAAGGVGLLVTVDCGITAVAEVAAARAAGMDVVVTDHHRPGARASGLSDRPSGPGGLSLPRALRGRRGAQALGRAARPRRTRPGRGRGGSRSGRARDGVRRGAAARREPADRARGRGGDRADAQARAAGAHEGGVGRAGRGG